MRVLVHSNAPWCPTGYGIQTRLFSERLKAGGLDVAISAYHGLNGAPITADGTRVFPGGRDPFGNDVVCGHAIQHFEGDLRGGLVLGFTDAWVLEPNVWGNLNAVYWLPVDHDPVPPRVLQAVRDSGAVPLAMSRHGERLLTEAGLHPLYCPHAVDTEALRPMDRQAALQVTGLPRDRFIVGMVAANKGFPSRKSFPEAIEAFGRLLKKHGDALLYLHTEAIGVHDGVNLPRLLADLDIPPTAVHFCDQYRYACLHYNDAYMRAAYSSMDVLLSPSAGEGFGVPIVEAQACGTPVIVSDFTAMTELCGAGWLVGGQRVRTTQESWQLCPSIDEIACMLEAAYDHAGALRDSAREFAISYDADAVAVKHMVPALQEAARRHEGRANARETPSEVAA